MSLFSKAIGWAAGAAEAYFGTTGFTKTVSTVGSFIDTVQGSAVGQAVGSYVAGRLGGDSPDKYQGFQTPQMESASAYRGVATTAGSFKASQSSPLRGTGMENPAVQRAWQKASQNPRIQASLEVVRPTTGKRGPTKSLAEAKLK